MKKKVKIQKAKKVKLPGEDYHDKGNIWYKGSYLNGKARGCWQTQPKSERPSYKGSYVKGVKEGLWTHFHENGKIASVCFYVAGIKQGLSIEYNEQGEHTISVNYSFV